MSVSIIPERRPIEVGFQDGEVTIDVYFTGLSQDDVQVSITPISGPEQEWYLDSEDDITPAGLPEDVYWKRFIFEVPINDTGTGTGDDGENYEAAFFFSAGGVTESIYCTVYPYDVAYGIEPTITPSPVEVPINGGTAIFTGSSDLGDSLEAFSLAGVFTPTLIGTESIVDQWDTPWTYYYFQVSASGPTGVDKTDYIYVVPRVEGTVEDYWTGTKVKAFQSGSTLVPPTVEGAVGLLDLSPSGETRSVNVVYNLGNSGVASIHTPVTSSDWIKVIQTSRSQNGNIETRYYNVEAQANPTELFRECYITWSISSGSNYTDSGFTTVDQDGGTPATYTPPTVDPVPGLLDIAIVGETKSLNVTYDMGDSGVAVINTPVTSSNWFRVNEVSRSVSGSKVQVNYSGVFQANTGSSTREEDTIVWSVSSGSNYTHSRTTHVNQEGRHIVLTPTESVLAPNQTGTTFTARYYGVNDSSSILSPVLNDDSWSITKVSGQEGSDFVEISWGLSGPANISGTPKIITATVTLEGVVDEIFTVIQGAQDTQGINVTGDTIEWYESTGSFTVEYNLGSSGMISTPSFVGGTLLDSTLISTAGTIQTWSYLVGVGTNENYDSIKTVSGTFKIYQGPSVTGYITQSRCARFDPTIIVSSPVSVGSNVTSVNIPVTYSRVISQSNVKAPVPGSGIVSVNSNLNLDYPDVKGTYTVVIPANTGTSEKTYNLTFKAESGSVSTQNSVVIRQSAGSSTVTGINLSWTQYSAGYSEDTFYIDATYVGTTDASQVGTCMSNLSGWVASPVSSEVVGNNLKITWKLEGYRNTSSSSRTITYTFAAVGGSTATASITQRGISGGTDRGIKAAWKNDVKVNVYDSTTPVEAYSGSRVLFSDCLFPEPGKAYAELNICRLAESYMEPREFPQATRSSSLFSLTVDYDGNSDTYWVVDDWSYDSDVYPHLEYTLSKPYQNIVAEGQYVIFSILRTADTYAGAIQYGPVGSLNTLTPGNNLYTDLVTRAGQCGTYRVISNGVSLASWDVTSRYKWVVYYYNKYAGWDSFVLKGPVVPGEKTTPERYLLSRRNFKTYQVGASETFRVTTGTLTDRESQAIAEIITSPSIVLHDLENDKLVSVTCNSNTVERKTFRNQGRMFANYTLEFESNLSRIRR